MADRPIIFSKPMVLALLDGRKTQTRRLATSPLRRCVPGDRLWVRENFRHWRGSASGITAVYEADDRWLDHGSGETFIDKVQWLTPVTPSIHMPRWASRLTLTVLAARVEPLQSISEADAIAEGMLWRPAPLEGWSAMPDENWPVFKDPRRSYLGLWKHLHKTEGSRWEDNPDVLVLTFSIERRNIDKIGGE